MIRTLFYSSSNISQLLSECWQQTEIRQIVNNNNRIDLYEMWHPMIPTPYHFVSILIITIVGREKYYLCYLLSQLSLSQNGHNERKMVSLKTTVKMAFLVLGKQLQHDHYPYYNGVRWCVHRFR